MATTPIPRPRQPFLTGGVLGTDPRFIAPMMSPTPMAGQTPLGAPQQQPAPQPGPLAGVQPMSPQAPAGGMTAPGGPLSAAASATPAGPSQGFGGRMNDFLGSPSALGLAAGILEGGTSGQALGRGFNYALQSQQQKEDLPGLVGEFAAAKRSGIWDGDFPSFVEARKAGGVSVSVGGDSAPGLGKLSSDYGYVLDPTTREPVIDPNTGLPRAAPVPGSPAALEAEQAAAAEESQQQTGAQSSDIVLGAIDDARTIFKASPGWTTGLGGSIALNIPGSGAVDLQEAIAPIEASIAFDRLQKMRDESPTGGALGQVSERELALLAATIASLKQSQSPEAFERNLNKTETVYKAIAEKFAAYPNAATYGFAPPENAGGNAAPPSGGWTDMGNGIRVREMP